jgi:hypothetical protein
MSATPAADHQTVRNTEIDLGHGLPGSQCSVRSLSSACPPCLTKPSAVPDHALQSAHQTAKADPRSHRVPLSGPGRQKRISREISERTNHCRSNAAHAATTKVASQVLGVLLLSAAAASDTGLILGRPAHHDSSHDHPVAATTPTTTAQMNVGRRLTPRLASSTSRFPRSIDLWL